MEWHHTFAIAVALALIIGRPKPLLFCVVLFAFLGTIALSESTRNVAALSLSLAAVLVAFGGAREVTVGALGAVMVAAYPLGVFLDLPWDATYAIVDTIALCILLVVARIDRHISRIYSSILVAVGDFRRVPSSIGRDSAARHSKADGA